MQMLEVTKTTTTITYDLVTVTFLARAFERLLSIFRTKNFHLSSVAVELKRYNNAVIFSVAFVASRGRLEDQDYRYLD